MTNDRKIQIERNVRSMFPIGTKVRSTLGNDIRTFDIETQNLKWKVWLEHIMLLSIRSDGGNSTKYHRYRVVWSSNDGYASVVAPVTKETKMLDVDVPHKKWFHTFDYKDRIVTLVLIRNNASETLSSGYSVKHMDDDMNEELGQRIAIGRASTARTNLLPKLPMIDLSIINQFVAKAIMETLEFKIKRGIIEIKGIR